MKIKRYVKITTQTEFIHCWPEAPKEVYYLRQPHRHMLHIHVTISVRHNERDIEFIMLKHEVNKLMAETDFQINASCETVAEYLLTALRDKYGATRKYQVEVYEDGENGAIIKA